MSHFEMIVWQGNGEAGESPDLWSLITAPHTSYICKHLLCKNSNCITKLVSDMGSSFMGSFTVVNNILKHWLTFCIVCATHFLHVSSIIHR